MLQVAAGLLLTFFDMIDGKSAPTQSAIDHTAAITSLCPSYCLQHLATSSQDGTLMLWNTRKCLARTLLLAQPISAACFLNDAGDVLAALGKSLVVIRADMYKHVPAMEKDAITGISRCATLLCT